MSLKKYLKDSAWKIIYVLTIVFVIDLVLISSTPISKSIYDIAYMNILILSISLVFLSIGFLRWKSNYKEFYRAISQNKSIDLSLPKGNSLEDELIRESIKVKNRESYDLNNKLKCHLNEINDYITKWVHEIKIPISVCELIADKIEEVESNEYSCEITQDLRIELERIKFLVNQVLYTSRASSYSEDLVIEELNLEKIVKDTVKKNASFFISKRITIELGNLDFNIRTDKKWISYILDQLLNNAWKYVGHNGTIGIYGEENERMIKLSIKDDGIGILPRDIDRVFDKGFTGNNGRHIPKSTGMGLYLSKKMARKLGHEIEVSSKEGSYTKFTINFYKFSDYFDVTKM